MIKKAKIPDIVIKRLPLYLRVLEDLCSKDRVIVSSHELGELAGLTPAQVRKDLTYFGEFGRQGVGYDTKFLSAQLREILGLNREVRIGLVGVGHLGLALARYNIGESFEQPSRSNLKVVALFDTDPEKVGTSINGVMIYHTRELQERIRGLDIKMIIITVPAKVSQEVADMACRAGIKAILNFSPVKLKVPDDVRLYTSDLTVELQSLAYYVGF